MGHSLRKIARTFSSSPEPVWNGVLWCAGIVVMLWFAAVIWGWAI